MLTPANLSRALLQRAPRHGRFRLDRGLHVRQRNSEPRHGCGRLTGSCAKQGMPPRAMSARMFRHSPWPCAQQLSRFRLAPEGFRPAPAFSSARIGRPGHLIGIGRNAPRPSPRPATKFAFDILAIVSACARKPAFMFQLPDRAAMAAARDLAGFAPPGGYADSADSRARRAASSETAVTTFGLLALDTFELKPLVSSNRASSPETESRCVGGFLRELSARRSGSPGATALRTPSRSGWHARRVLHRWCAHWSGRHFRSQPHIPAIFSRPPQVPHGLPRICRTAYSFAEVLETNQIGPHKNIARSPRSGAATRPTYSFNRPCW